MKRILPLFLALSVAPLAYAAADPAPATPAAAPAPETPAVVDAAAGALLEKSTQAYTAATGQSLKFTTTRVSGAKATTTITTGEVSFVRPDQARVLIKTGDQSTLVVADSEKLWREVPTTPVSYVVNDVKGPQSIAVALNGLNNSTGFPISSLLSGRSLMKLGYTWETVTALPDNAVKLVGHAGKAAEAPQYSMVISFDPATSLITKSEITMNFRGTTSVTSTTFTDVKANPEFTPGTFAYVPAAGVKEYVQPPSYDPRLVVGAEPFALKGVDMDGKGSDWSQYKGKVVLLDFWATWCGPCVGELPNVLKNYDTYHAKGFDIVGVSLDSDKQALVDFVKAHPSMTYPNLFDGLFWKNVNAQAYGVQAIPFSLLIGKDGKIAAVNPRGEKLEPAINAALAQ